MPPGCGVLRFVADDPQGVANHVELTGNCIQLIGECAGGLEDAPEANQRETPLPDCWERGWVRITFYAAGVASAASGVAPAPVGVIPASSARSASPTFSAVISAGSINVVCSAGSVPSRRK